MGRTKQIIAREGTLASVASGARVRINPGLIDSVGNVLDVDEADVFGPFFVASYNGDGTFDVQSIASGTQPLRWVAKYLHSDQHKSTQSLQIGEGPSPGQDPSPDPPIALLSSGATLAGSLESPDTYTCPIGTVIGDAVYMSGVGVVGLARSNSLSTMPCAGIVASKPSPTTCKIIGVGFISSFPGGTTPGDFYYVDKTIAGQLTTTPPIGPSIIQPVGLGYGNNVLLVNLGPTITLV